MPRVRFEEILNERAYRVRNRFEVPVMVAAVAVVPVIVIEGEAASPLWQSIAHLANWVIWGIFLVEFVTVVSLTERKLEYARSAWLDLVIIVTSFPMLPGLLGSTRLFRLARLGRVLRILRLARLAAVVTRGGAAARVLFRKRGLGYVIVITLLVGMGIGGAFAILEDTPIGDSLWWAIVTMTTVGYGDMFPVTTAGRVAASVLMLLGIGFVAVITATVAAHFVDDDRGEPSELTEIRQRLERIEQLLESSQPTARDD